jgi:hypothetical protein
MCADSYYWTSPTQMTQMRAAQINKIIECKICEVRAACICVICVQKK